MFRRRPTDEMPTGPLASAVGIGAWGNASSTMDSAKSKLEVFADGVEFRLHTNFRSASADFIAWDTVQDWTLLGLSPENMQTLIRFQRPVDADTHVCSIVTDRGTAFLLAKEAKAYLRVGQFINEWTSTEPAEVRPLAAAIGPGSWYTAKEEEFESEESIFGLLEQGLAFTLYMSDFDGSSFMVPWDKIMGWGTATAAEDVIETRVAFPMSGEVNLITITTDFETTARLMATAMMFLTQDKFEPIPRSSDL